MTGLLFVMVLTAHLFYIFSRFITYIWFHLLGEVKKREVMQYITWLFKEDGVLLLYSGPKLLLFSYTNTLPLLATFAT